MGERRARFHLYCEDSGHEAFVRSLVRRLADEAGLPVSIQTLSGRGGHPRAMAEFRLFQRAAGKGLISGAPDLLLLVIDSNCNDWNQFRASLETSIDRTIFPRWIVGCPEPHVERWCFADPVAFRAVVGADPPPDPGKCERGLYKQLLRATLRDSPTVIVTSEMEIAPDLVAAMDLFSAGKRDRSLKHFVDGLRAAILNLDRT